MALTKEQIKAREGKLTASQVSILMNGSPEAIVNLWRNLVGDPAYVDTDLSGVWPVQLGNVTEQLQLDWYERKRHCKVTRRGEVVVMKGRDWAAATLDGWQSELGFPIECKHVNGRTPLAAVIERYLPQVHWQMLVCGTQTADMSIIEGAAEPVIETIQMDHEFAAALMKRAEAFMQSVKSLTPPIALPSVEKPVLSVKTYDMTGKNEWASYAVQWLENKPAARLAMEADKSLKTLVPIDAKKAVGHGVEIARDRAGRLSLREAA